MWVTKLLISPVKKGFFAQKRPNLAQNWHFWSIWARPCRLIQCPVCGSVGGCGARAVSRKTPIYFICWSTSDKMYRVSKRNWVLPNWSFADPARNWGEILHDFFGKSSCIMLWVGNFNAFIGRFADTALGAYRVWKGALKNKRLHKNKWFLNIIQTGINPTTPDLTGSTGFFTKNYKYFSPIASRICKCFIWQNSVLLETPCSITISYLVPKLVCTSSKLVN